MRVQCPSCASAYNFDESLIGPAGISLKCTACGHVFQLAALTALAPGNVRVRRAATGEVHDFVDLAEVERAILEQRFARADLLSRTGSHWAPIAQVPELQSALGLAELTTSTEPLSPQPRPATLPPGNTQVFAQQVVAQPVAPVISAGATRALNTDGSPLGRAASPSGAQPIAETRPFARQTGQALAMPDPAFDGPSRNVAGAVARLDTAEVERKRIQGTAGAIAGAGDEGWALESPKPAAQEWTVGDAPLRPTRTEPGRRPAEPARRVPGGVRNAPEARRPAPDPVGPDPLDTGELDAMRPLGGARRAGSWPIAVAIVLSTLIVVVAVVPDFRNALLGRDDAPPATTAPETVAPGTAAPGATASVTDAGAAGGASARPDAAIATTNTTGDGSAAPSGTPSTGPDGSGAAGTPGAPDPSAPAVDAGAATATGATAPSAAVPPPSTPAPRPPDAPRTEQTTSHDALMQRGNAALADGRHEAALAAFTEAADRYNRTEAHVGMARVFAATGRRALAIARYERALDDNARYQPAWIELAALLEDDGAQDRAIAAYRQVIAIRDTGSAADRARAALARLDAE